MPKRKPDESTQARQFGAALTVLLLALAGLSAWRAHPGRAALLAGAAALASSLALLAPGVWRVIFRRWMKVAHAIAWVVTRVVLITFFYGMMTPFCVVLRLFGTARREHSFRDGRASHWVPRAPVPATLERYRKSY